MAKYLLTRFLQFLIVIFLSVTLVFIIVRMMPSDPVEKTIAQITSTGTFLDPADVEKMIKSLREMYGLEGSILSQYFQTWKRLLTLNFGPSLSFFPTPVSSIIKESVFWTIGLLGVVILVSWVIGNVLGVIAGYYSKKLPVAMKLIDLIFMVIRPIPYYILAFIFLVLFSYLIPAFPSQGAYSVGMIPGFNLPFIIDVLKHATLPALSMILLQTTMWFQSMKIISTGVANEDFVIYAKYGGIPNRKIIFKYVFRNALLPQVTSLSLSLGRIFGGALITEIVFSYPGLGGTLYSAIMSSDYNLIIGIVLFSIVAVSLGTLILDFIYPLFDPRIRYS